MICPKCKKKVGKSIPRLSYEKKDIKAEEILNKESMNNNDTDQTKAKPLLTNSDKHQDNFNTKINSVDETGKTGDDDELNSINSFSEMRGDTKMFLKSLKRKRQMIEIKQSEKNLQETIEKMKEFDDSIDVRQYDKDIFKNVQKGSGKGFLNLTKESIVWVDDNKSKWCISKSCDGKSEVQLKEIIGESTSKKKYAISSHRKCLD
jgi:hypothetical protein